MIKSRVDWTDEDTNLVLENFETIGAEGLIQMMPDRTLCSIKHKANRLGMRAPTNRSWTAEELDYLKTHYKLHGGPRVAKKLGRSLHAVNQKASRLRTLEDQHKVTKDVLTIKTRWSTKEDDIIRDLYPEGGVGAVMCAFDNSRTEHDIHNRASFLGVSNDCWILDSGKVVRRWTAEHIELLERNMDDKSLQELAELFPGRSIKSVKHKLYELRTEKKEARDGHPNAHFTTNSTAGE